MHPTLAAYRLDRITGGVVLLTLCGIPYALRWGMPVALAWALAAIWMMANIWCLSGLIRAIIAPPPEVDKRRGIVYGLLVGLFMPALLLGLLYWGMQRGNPKEPSPKLIAIALGITLPLAVLLLKALGNAISARPIPKPPSS